VRVTDASGDLVALFKGTAYRKKETLAEVAARARRGRRRTVERSRSRGGKP